MVLIFTGLEVEEYRLLRYNITYSAASGSDASRPYIITYMGELIPALKLLMWSDIHISMCEEDIIVSKIGKSAEIPLPVLGVVRRIKQ